MFLDGNLWKCILVTFLWCALVKAQLSNEVDEHLSYFDFGHPTSAGLSAQPHPMSFAMEAHAPKEDKRGALVLDILHGLLSKYDNRIRPFAPDAELFVKVSFGGVEIVDVLEGKEELNSIVILEQTWTDPRLMFEENEEEDYSEIEYITITHEHTREIWVPDTFFVNEKKTQVHEGATGNDAITVYRNGTVSRSVRVAVNTHCQFDYKDFPFDAQTCALEIGSHAYRSSDVTYGWEEVFVGDVMGVGNNAKHFAATIRTGKFSVVGMSLNQSMPMFNNGRMSRLTFRLVLQRAWKPFVTRYFLPCVLFVFVSLGTMFFADYRVALVVNLFNLAFVNIFVVLRTSSPDLPTISTSTAYDTYFILCLSYIVVVLLITVYNLICSQRASFSPHCAVQQPSSSTHRSQTFPESVQLRPNRRRNNDQDIFSPNEDIGESYGREENGGNGSLNNGGDTEFQRIYRTTSYPIRMSGRWKWAWRKSTKIGQWVWKHMKWILLGAFLLTDLIFFKTHSVQYA